MVVLLVVEIDISLVLIVIIFIFIGIFYGVFLKPKFMILSPFFVFYPIKH